MRIAVLGWGSLIWDYTEITTRWKRTKLISFPLEFMRLSNGVRLTLVIDERGEDNNLYYATSNYENLNKAIHSLRIREKTTIKNIGYLIYESEKYRSFIDLEREKTGVQIKHKLLTFMKIHKYDACIWTDLRSNLSTKEWLKLVSDNDFLMSKTVFDYIRKAIENGIETKLSAIIDENEEAEDEE